MEDKLKERNFQGKNLKVIEANVQQFVIELGESYKDQKLLSNNPDYVIRVYYTEN